MRHLPSRRHRAGEQPIPVRYWCVSLLTYKQDHLPQVTILDYLIDHTTFSLKALCFSRWFIERKPWRNMHIYLDYIRKEENEGGASQLWECCTNRSEPVHVIFIHNTKCCIIERLIQFTLQGRRPPTNSSDTSPPWNINSYIQPLYTIQHLPHLIKSCLPPPTSGSTHYHRHHPFYLFVSPETVDFCICVQQREHTKKEQWVVSGK